MSTISAKLVKELRERTNCGMMECKKALTETNGNIEEAIELMKKAGQAKAVKKAGRVAAEGTIASYLSNDKKVAALVDLNSETDFVAREGAFKEFAENIAKTALENNISDLSKLLETKLVNSNNTVEEMRLELVSKLGENITIRRVMLINAPEGGVVGEYTHSDGKVAKIGALCAVNIQDEELARDLAMHISAMNPEYLDKDQVPGDRVEKEKQFLIDQAREQNPDKADDILEKIIIGRVNKFLKEITLMGQVFVKDQDKTIESLLKDKNANVTQYVRFEVGEGITKVEDDFVKEVMSQARGA